ncbi:MAG: FKBP-type peptidyl-prolyl cis-trans isomerase [Bacteroidales bacterium]|nr:FKBP-type peptidyl-prolyl cis-trans isomerase [Candidatus Sodaliphilus aphodohippi]
MKKIFSIILAAGMIMSIASCNKKAEANSASADIDSVSILIGQLYGNQLAQQLKQDSTIDMKDVISTIQTVLKTDTANHGKIAGYNIGMQMMQMFSQIKQQEGFELNQKVFLDSFKKALNFKGEINDQEMMKLQSQLEPLIEKASKAAKAPIAAKNKKDGEEYMKKMAGKGYTKTASGLLYKVIKPGNGENFKDGDVVMTIYTGKHINGEIFDKSEQPVPFSTQQVIPGFAEMIKLMKPGEKVEVIIPAALAYGEEGNPAIGPNETLVFEMETVEISKQKDDQQTMPIPVQ